MTNFKIESSDVKANGNTVTSFKGVQLWENGKLVCSLSGKTWNNISFGIDTFEAIAIENVFNRTFEILVLEEVFNVLKKECLRLADTDSANAELSDWVYHILED